MAYSLEKVLKIVIEKGYSIDWEAPYEITNIPEDLGKLASIETGFATYWIRGQGLKSKKITQFSFGAISDLYFIRTIFPPLKSKIEDFDSAKITSSRNSASNIKMNEHSVDNNEANQNSQ
ncbi:hypothetical protein [Leptospira adleri]|uniref:Uncharacterized protein n=1 Tax=Leptospira adleri TaxID=2023186 RepID=A0A2M9YJA0_9LEPT|nr:hypothetical protein [Leptospira adleri]PJZ51621.1 hypothetical protein CH380_19440 [Leptospira adleri]PJZ61870.1 hypothetical protein CH376_10725 [Leptospira adleri]